MSVTLDSQSLQTYIKKCEEYLTCPRTELQKKFVGLVPALTSTPDASLLKIHVAVRNQQNFLDMSAQFLNAKMKSSKGSKHQVGDLIAYRQAQQKLNGVDSSSKALSELITATNIYLKVEKVVKSLQAARRALYEIHEERSKV